MVLKRHESGVSRKDIDADKPPLPIFDARLVGPIERRNMTEVGDFTRAMILLGFQKRGSAPRRVTGHETD